MAKLADVSFRVTEAYLCSVRGAWRLMINSVRLLARHGAFGRLDSKGDGFADAHLADELSGLPGPGLVLHAALLLGVVAA